MINKKIKYLENEIDDLNRRVEFLSTAIVVLIEKVDPEGFQETLDKVYGDDNVS